MFLSLEFVVTMATSLLVACRSDSDSEGENPEKKKLQEQLMGTSVIMVCFVVAQVIVSKCLNDLFQLMSCVVLSLWVRLFSVGSKTYPIMILFFIGLNFVLSSVMHANEIQHCVLVRFLLRFRRCSYSNFYCYSCFITQLNG